MFYLAGGPLAKIFLLSLGLLLFRRRAPCKVFINKHNLILFGSSVKEPLIEFTQLFAHPGLFWKCQTRSLKFMNFIDDDRSKQQGGWVHKSLERSPFYKISIQKHCFSKIILQIFRSTKNTWPDRFVWHILLSCELHMMWHHDRRGGSRLQREPFCHFPHDDQTIIALSQGTPGHILINFHLLW